MIHPQKIHLKREARPAILLAILIAISFLADARHAFSDTVVSFNCSGWSIFPDARVRKIYSVHIAERPFEQPGLIPGDDPGEYVEGVFKFDGPDGPNNQIIALWEDSREGYAFTTQLRGKKIRFTPVDPKRKATFVRFGLLSSPPSLKSGIQLLTPEPLYCVRAKGIDADEREVFVLIPTSPPGLAAGKDSGDVEIKGGIKTGPSIADKLSKFSGDPPAGDAPARPTITEITKNAAAAAGEAPPAATEPPGKKPAADTGETDDGEPKKKKESKPEEDAEAGKKPSSICSWKDLAEVPAPLNAAELPSTFAIGIRNKEKMAQGYDFIRITGGDVVMRDFMVNLGASTAKSMIFEPVAPPSSLTIDGEDTDVLPVSVSGTDALPREQITKDAPKPAATLKVVVVGAPEEVAISGLGDVGKRLRKLSHGRIGVEVEWYSVDSTGHLGKPVSFKSLEETVKAAAAGANGERFIVLGTTEFLSFLDEFQKTLTQRPGTIDRVFWVKGAYRLPSVAPKHLEDLLTTLAEASVIPRRPNGEAEQWLTIVTARMPGFSVAYLKEPVSVLNAGDVVDEPPDQTEPRRLIVDPSAIATSLSSLGELRAGKGSAAGPAKEGGTVSDLLVLNGYDVFGERGYALSNAALAELSDRLAELAQVWMKDGSSEQVSRFLVKKTDKPSPSIGDFLETSPLEGLRLRFMLPWVRAPFADLSETERSAAEEFVVNLNESISKIEKRVAAQKNSPCGFIYVRNADLGLN